MSVPILAAVRSPFAAADGVLAGWHPVDLAALVADEAVARAGLDPERIEHVWVGCDEPVGAQGANLARATVLASGWPETVGGTVVEAVPHSGMSALAAAVDALTAGRVDTAVVIGVSSASLVQPGASALARLYGRPWGEQPAARYENAGGLVPPVVAADRAALSFGIGRAAQDAWGLQSIERRPREPHDGIVAVGARPGDAIAVQRDTPVTADVHRVIPLDELAPIFEQDGTTTAAGFAPAADGVAVLVLGRAGDGIAELHAVGSAACSPFEIGPALVRALGAPPAEPPADAVDLAAQSASMVLVARDALGLGPAVVDPDGGTIAVGDAGAAEDLRLIVDGIHRSSAGTVRRAARVAPGAAAGCLWHRL